MGKYSLVLVHASSWSHHYFIGTTSLPLCPPVTSQSHHYLFHVTVQLYHPVTSQWHHYPFHTTVWLCPPSDITMTSLSLPDNSNRTCSPVTSRHYPFHTAVQLYHPVTSQWHHYPFHTAVQLYHPVTSQWHHYPFQTTAIGLVPQWHHLSTPSIQQFDSVPQWHHYHIHTAVWLDPPSDITITSIQQFDSIPPVTSLSHPYSSLTRSPQWHHYLIHTAVWLDPPSDITITSIQQFDSVPQWHHYHIHTTVWLCPPVTSLPHPYNNSTLSPSDITITSIPQFNSVPQWHHYDITIPSIQQQYDLFPSDMMTSLSHSYTSSTTLFSQWHHDITIPLIQQQYNSIPLWHVSLPHPDNCPPVTSCRMTLAPVTSCYPIHTTIRLSLSDWCTSDVTGCLACPLTHSCQSPWKVANRRWLSLKEKKKKKRKKKKPSNLKFFFFFFKLDQYPAYMNVYVVITHAT